MPTQTKIGLLKLASQFRIMESTEGAGKDRYVLTTDNSQDVLDFITKHQIENSSKHKVLAMIIMGSVSSSFISTFSPAEFIDTHNAQQAGEKEQT